MPRTSVGIVFGIDREETNKKFFEIIDSRVPRVAGSTKLHTTVGRFFFTPNAHMAYELLEDVDEIVGESADKPVRIEFDTIRVISMNSRKVYVVLKLKPNDRLKALANAVIEASEKTGVEFSPKTVHTFTDPTFHVTIGKFYRIKNDRSGDNLNVPIDELNDWIEPDQFKDGETVESYIKNLKDVFQDLDDLKPECDLKISVAHKYYDDFEDIPSGEDKPKPVKPKKNDLALFFIQPMQKNIQITFASALQDFNKKSVDNGWPEFDKFFSRNLIAHPFYVQRGEEKSLYDVYTSQYPSTKPLELSLLNSKVVCRPVSSSNLHICLEIRPETQCNYDDRTWIVKFFWELISKISGTSCYEQSSVIKVFENILKLDRKSCSKYNLYAENINQIIKQGVFFLRLGEVKGKFGSEEDRLIKPISELGTYDLNKDCFNGSDDLNSYVHAAADFAKTVEDKVVQVQILNSVGKLA